jgi:hypothetical protein
MGKRKSTMGSRRMKVESGGVGGQARRRDGRTLTRSVRWKEPSRFSNRHILSPLCFTWRYKCQKKGPAVPGFPEWNIAGVPLAIGGLRQGVQGVFHERGNGAACVFLFSANYGLGSSGQLRGRRKNGGPSSKLGVSEPPHSKGDPSARVGGRAGVVLLTF